MSLIIGVDDFGKVITRNLGYVDKSLFIKEIIDNDEIEVSVIVRPRRFGKTLNMTMLHHFLAAEVNQLKTAGMFDHLKIAQQGEQYMQHQGKYPVIFVSFKGVKDSKFQDAYAQLEILIAEAYREHRYLATSDKLHADEKKTYEDIVTRTAHKSVLENSLKELTRLLHLHHGVKPWLLMDEYDTPIQAGYLNGYYSEMIEIMRVLFGGALKGNNHLHRAVVTGILRVAKENLFSGLNNLKVYSVLNKKYSDYFGFTENEVDVVLNKNNLSSLASGIKAWYNGYQIGNSRIYNPWSIACCIEEEGILKPYWINTSENSLIKTLLAKSDAHFKTRFESILNNQPIDTALDESLVFSDLHKNEEAIWSLLLFSGYLTAVSAHQNDIDFTYSYSLRSPNQEILTLYRSTVLKWFTQGGDEFLHQLLRSLTEGDVESFLALLQRTLLESMSYFDSSEKFYHGFVLGLVISLAKTHIVHSNRESGLGRYDVMLIPKDKIKPGIILEFKVAKPEEDLQDSAKEALTQIHQKNHTAELAQQGIERIIKIGLAFRGKDVAMASE